jgi:GntR family transcriptional regulator/MocR family aminotransferase
MQLPIRVSHDDALSLQGQIFEKLRGLILDGRLKPGTHVPPTRLLAQQLGVSRNTVILAYERLITEGYLQTRTSVGTFVSRDLPETCLQMSPQTAEQEREAERLANRRRVHFPGRRHPVVNRNRHRLAVDFWVGRPDSRSFPIKAWRRLINAALSRAGSNLTEYGDPGGLPALRQAIADYLGPARGITTTAEQVIIVAGCQEALNLAARLFVSNGSPVVIECPGYQGASNLMESYGAQVVPVPVDNDGIDVTQLPQGEASLAYVTPSHQYPMGVTLSLERRLRLLDWAWKSGAYIVEDDYDSDFRYQGSPLTALKGLDARGSVLYLGTFSKSVGAGIRLGYVVVPKELVEPATTAKALLDNGHPWLDQAVMAEFIASGSYANHLRRIRHTYMVRRDCLVNALRRHFGDVDLSGLEGGMHLVWHLPDDFPDAQTFERWAFERGVGVYSLDQGAANAFHQTECARRAVMLGYSSTPEKLIEEGVGRLAAMAAERRHKIAVPMTDVKGIARRMVQSGPRIGHSSLGG